MIFAKLHELYKKQLNKTPKPPPLIPHKSSPCISNAGSMQMLGPNPEFFLDPGADVAGDLFGGVHV